MSHISGLLYAYYFICKRKTWLVGNGISLESENEDVQLGKIIDENSYSHERKHILIDETASIDFFRDKTVYEIKKSSAEKPAAISQIKYYLYILKTKGVEADGELRIPKENLVELVCLDDQDIQLIHKNLMGIEYLLAEEKAPAVLDKKLICKKCAFFELCYI